jgi:hypothetical protein
MGDAKESKCARIMAPYTTITCDSTSTFTGVSRDYRGQPAKAKAKYGTSSTSVIKML